MRHKSTTLAHDAEKRLEWMEAYSITHNARKVCREFKISPSTFYHWRKRFRPEDMTSLQDTASRRPKTPKKTKWTHATLLTIGRLIEHNPHTKHKTIQQFLAKQDVQLSASTITRIMKRYRLQKEKLS